MENVSSDEIVLQTIKSAIAHGRELEGETIHFGNNAQTVVSSGNDTSTVISFGVESIPVIS